MVSMDDEKEKGEYKDTEEVVIMISTSSCPACEMMKEKLEDEIKKGQIIPLNADTNELGREIAKRLEILSVPTFVLAVKDKKTGKVMFCKLNDDGSMTDKCVEYIPPE